MRILIFLQFPILQHILHLISLYLNIYQNSYKKGHTTETVSLATMHYMYFSLDKYNRIQLLQIDFSSTFYSI